MDDDPGWVYCLSNPSFLETILKVGLSRQDDLSERIDGLSNTTSVPTPFKLEFAAKFKNCGQAEKNIHTLLSHFRSRINDAREFFECNIEDVKIAFKSQCPLGDFVNVTDEKNQTKLNRDYNIFDHMQRIRHPRNLENGDVRDVLYGYRDELRSCFCLEDDPEVTFDTLSAFEKYHLKGLGIELKGGGNGWKTCEVEVGGIWIKAHVHHERINNRVQVETKDGGPSC